MNYVSVTIKTQKRVINLDIKTWLVQAMIAGIIIGMVVAINVAFNPLFTFHLTKLALLVGMAYWALVAMVIWGAHWVADEAQKPPIRFELQKPEAA